MARYEFHNVGSISGHAFGDGAVVNNPPAAPAPAPVGGGGIGDLRSQLGQLTMQLSQVSQHQGATYEQAEELGAQVAQIAQESARPEVGEAAAAVQQALQQMSQARAALVTAQSQLDTYAASL